MKVIARIALGSSFVLLLLVAILAYHVTQVRKLARVSGRLAGREFATATLSVELLRVVDLLEEYVRKYALTGDPGYHQRLVEGQELFATRLATLEGLPLSGGEALRERVLRRSWDRLVESGVLAGPQASLQETGEERAIGALEAVHRDLQQLMAATRGTISAEVSEAASTARHAERASGIVVGAAFLATLAVLAANGRYISVRLRRLTEATRIVSKGAFSFRLAEGPGDEFALLTAAFNEMTARLGELDRLKRDFLSLVSHELRTPLVAIQETVRLVLEGIPGPLNAEQRRLLDLCAQAGERLSRMIRDLLDLSRMEAGAMRYDVRLHDLNVVVRRALEEFEVRARETGVAIEFSPTGRPLHVEVDDARVTQLVQNLVGNALMFSAPGSRIGVGVASMNGGGELVVSDSGPGIPEPERERVFEKFHQVPGRGSPGAGLGLAVVHEIVRAHGGSVRVEDAPGGGARFVVFLPGTVPVSEPGEGGAHALA